MSRKGKRRLAAAAALLVALALGVWLVAGRADADVGDEWVEVVREDLVVGVEVSGTLSAVRSVSIGPPSVPEVWDYKIAFMAPEGAQVQEGQPVLGFDASTLEQRLFEKVAERDSAEKELEKTRTNLDKTLRDLELQLAEAEARQRRASLKVDVPEDLVASKELAESRAELDLARLEIASLKERLRLQKQQARAEIETLRRRRDRAAARVAESRAAIERMTIKAPKAGTIIYVTDHGGEKGKVGDSVWRGRQVLEIPDLRSMRAEGEVSEADAGRIRVGQPVSLRLDAHPDVVFTGKVAAIRGAVQQRRGSGRKVVRVDVALDGTDPQRMRPGMRFAGTVEVERVAGALVVPLDAVFQRDDGPVVYRRGPWGAEAVEPSLGRRNDRLAEVVGGLSPGDRVSRRDLGGEGAR